MWLIDLLNRGKDSVEFFKGKSNALLKIWPLNLNLAGEQTVDLQGNFIYVINASDTIANVNIQFSRKDSDIDRYNLTQGLGIIHPFDKLHISWAAQTGKTLDIWIGNLAPELLNVIDNRSGVVSSTLLTAILAELQGATVPQGFALVNIAAAATLITALNANRKSVIIQALHANVGDILLGYDNTVALNKYFLRLRPGEIYSVDDYRGTIYGFATVANDDVSYGEV